MGHEADDVTCPHCGVALERADDFWYCDNPDCPARPNLHRVAIRRSREGEETNGAGPED